MKSWWSKLRTLFMLFMMLLAVGPNTTVAEIKIKNGSEPTNSNASSVNRQVQIDDIIVVGDKIGRDLQKLPTSTAVIGQSRIENEPISNIDDVFNRVANVSTGLAQYGAYSIRGVNNNALQASFNQANVLATVFTNQVPLGGYTSDYLRPSTWDVRSVEILRGPQSTLQGPNSLIGAVFFNYNRPDFSTEGRVRTEYGEYETWNVAAVQNIPLVTDLLAARITAESRNSDGAVDGAVYNSDDVARVDEKMVRGQVLYQPLKTEDILFNLTGFFNESDSNPQARVMAFDAYSMSDRKNGENVPGDFPIDTLMLSLESEIKINDHWEVIAVTGYSKMDGDGMHYDGDLTSADLLSVDGQQEEKLINQDLRIRYTRERLRGLIGAYYSYADLSSMYVSAGFLPGLGNYSSVMDLGEEVTTAAIYGNFDYDVTDRITLNGGLRFNYENRENNNATDLNGMRAELGGEEDFQQVLPTVSVTYGFTEHIRAGFKYAKGYRSGGISVAPFAQQSQTYDEEFTDNYELFFRSRLADNRITLNGNIYYIDWQDQQIGVTVEGGVPGFDELTFNVGESELMGFELEATVDVTPNFECFFTLGYSDTEFKDFVVNGVDYSGQSLPNSPEWTFSIGANYTHYCGFFAGASYKWSDDSYAQVTTADHTALSTRSILDAKIGYRFDHWSVYLWGTNLLDDDFETNLYDARAFGLKKYGAMNTPIRIGVGMEIYW